MASKKQARGPIYAVVDLETTGTNARAGARIIQIGCVLVQAGRVINEFTTKLNPRTTIPHAIEQLTGITNAQVRDAPLFEDVAATLTSLLDDTIFVAHNVNFDFPFLNAELARAELPPLTIPAIDTVTLSQILMPTAASFRLRDLTAYLAIDHDQPHSAVSDALATSQLLIDLLKRLAALPTPTLTTLVDLDLNLPAQTAWVFERALAERQAHPQPLAEALYLSGDLVLHKRRPLAIPTDPAPAKYPATKRQKERLYAGRLTYRPLQAKMMNAIYNQFSRPDERRQLIVEAGTGTGKTLGYLLPLAYLAYPNHRIVVATATNLLQAQLARQTVQQLNQLLPFQLSAVVVKGNDHYLNLAKFVNSLAIHESSPVIQLLKARILVWLTQTTTGDLDELNLTAPPAAYFNEIRHQGVASLNQQSPYYRDDFLVRRDHQAANANLIITNHAYLVAHAQSLASGDSGAYLVVDEAQHLSQAVLKRARERLNFARVTAIGHQLENLVTPAGEPSLSQVFADLPLGAYNVELLAGDLQQLMTALTDLRRALLRLVTVDETAPVVEVALPNDQLASLLDPTNPLMVALDQARAAVNLHFAALRHLFNGQAERWLAADRYAMNQFASQLAALKTATQLLPMASQLLAQQEPAALFWLTVRQNGEQSALQLSGGLLLANHYLRREVYPYFGAELFTGATLFSSGRSAYLYRQLDLDRKAVRVKRLASPFDYGTNSRLWVATDAPVPGRTTSDADLTYLATTIDKLTRATQCQTMVLFNSLVTIEQVYTKLRGSDLFNQREVLAQGVTGSRRKLLKQFATGTRSVLFGAASFWEGIDLPKDQLELLIITRLPFDPPQELMNRAQQALLKAAGQNPFYQLEVPRATIRLRQGIGRLLRTETDRGAAVVLDPRLVTKRYGQTIQAALPQEMPVIAAPTDQIVLAAKQFITPSHRPEE